MQGLDLIPATFRKPFYKQLRCPCVYHFATFHHKDNKFTLKQI